MKKRRVSPKSIANLLKSPKLKSAQRKAILDKLGTSERKSSVARIAEDYLINH